MMASDDGLSPQVLRRQLSVTYIHDGVPTSADPESYEGDERKAREKSLLRQHPYTGHSDGIRLRAKRSTFFQPFSRVSDFLDAVLDPIVPPLYLAFRSLSYLFDVVKNCLNFIVDSAFALLVRPFSKKTSDVSFTLASIDFMDVRMGLLKSVVYAVASILAFVDNFVKLFTRTGASLVEPILGSDEEDNSLAPSF